MRSPIPLQHVINLGVVAQVRLSRGGWDSTWSEPVQLLADGGGGPLYEQHGFV